jgi:hypothetical protein
MPALEHEASHPHDVRIRGPAPAWTHRFVQVGKGAADGCRLIMHKSEADELRHYHRAQYARQGVSVLVRKADKAPELINMQSLPHLCSQP